MRILLVIPTSDGVIDGNFITARRWARHLRALGHPLEVANCYDGRPIDLMVALHARKSHDSIRSFQQQRSRGRLVVCLSGTDLYGDLQEHPAVQASLLWADRIVVLQEKAREALPKKLREKTRVIYQSALPLRSPPPRSRTRFRVSVVANLRSEKDPLLTARAAALLPASSRITVRLAGRLLDPNFEEPVREEVRTNPRFGWLGPQPHGRTRQLIASSHLVSISSRMEGGCNVLAEALALSVPVVCTAVPGLIGTVGADYPGLFPVGDTRALAQLLGRVETDPVFYKKLQKKCRDLRPLADPNFERQSWKRLLAELYLSS